GRLRSVGSGKVARASPGARVIEHSNSEQKARRRYSPPLALALAPRAPRAYTVSPAPTSGPDVGGARDGGPAALDAHRCASRSSHLRAGRRAGPSAPRRPVPDLRARSAGP